MVVNSFGKVNSSRQVNVALTRPSILDALSMVTPKSFSSVVGSSEVLLILYS